MHKGPLSGRGRPPWAAQLAPASSSPRETPPKAGRADGRPGRARGTWSQGGGGVHCLGGLVWFLKQAGRVCSKGGGGRLEGLAAFMHQADVRLWGPLFKDSPNLEKYRPRMEQF